MFKKRNTTYYLGFFCSLTLVILLLYSCNTTTQDPDKEDWIALFDGKGVDNWTPKFKDHPLGHNHKRIFRVEDSLLRVSYQAKDTFDGAFGHLFYNKKFSHYKLRATYRFVGDQLKNGPGWAFRNNGLMLHCQEPASMGLAQNFPISLELQLLGGDGNNPRSTANLCTPGTNVVLEGNFFEPHCTNSVSDTYHGDQWVTVEALVLGDSLIQHSLKGKAVLTYKKPTIGGGAVSGHHPADYVEGKALTEGYIAIQAETHPTDFKSIELLDLCGCTDKKAKNYKSYYVKSDNTRCIY